MSRQPVITLKPGKARPVRAGHPWIFSGAIHAVRGDVRALPCVQIHDDQGQSLGCGLYSPSSQIRVRMLHAAPAGYEGQLDAALLTRALVRLRRCRLLFGLPSAQTSAYRLVNSEGDGLPGLCVDVFGKLIVFQVSTLPMFQAREQIVAALRSAFAEVEGLAIRETGAPAGIAKIEGFEPEERWWGDAAPERVVFSECGVRFGIDTAQFQKTGHFADMRPHRRWVGQLSAGKAVLDAYSYTGGFGLFAALGGARKVVSVDSSAQATQRVVENAALNEVSDRVEAVTAKVDDYLRSAHDRGKRFDIIVLDPPKLAPSRQAAPKALKVYEAIAIQAARLLEPDGLLCITSCSEAIGLTELERVMGACAERTGRVFDAVYMGAQGEDHPWPASMPEGRYATFLGCVG
jgi:23S rRNA (cytosine1962-C5)-methyltransferase